jgi:hypothetical protein
MIKYSGYGRVFVEFRPVLSWRCGTRREASEGGDKYAEYQVHDW